MFIAYAYIGKREVQSSVHNSREAAALELLEAHRSLTSVATCTAYNGKPTGNHILSHNRPDDMVGKHRGFLS